MATLLVVLGAYTVCTSLRGEIMRTKYHWYSLVYVMDCSQEYGYEFKRKLPLFIVRMMLKRSDMCLDYCKEI